MELRQSVLTGVRWTAASRAVSQFLSWAGTILVMRLLAPEDYGVMAVGGFFIVYLTLLSEGGLSEALVRTRQLSERVEREIQGILVIINIACAVILICAAPFIASYFNEPKLRLMMPVLSSQFLIMSAGVLPQAQLTREMRFKDLSTIYLAQAVSTTMVTVVLALLGAGVWSLVVSNLAGQAVKSTLLVRRTRHFPVPLFQFREARAYAGFSGYVLFERTMWHIFSSVDLLFVGKFLGTTSTGIYTVAQNLASLPVSKVAGILVQIALPAFSHIQDDAERVRLAYLKAVRVIAVCAFPIGFGIALIASPAMDLILGTKWHGVAPVLATLCLAIPFRLMSTFDSPLLLALGLPKIMLQNRIGSVFILIAALSIGLRWGVLGIAAGWALSAPVIWLFTLTRFSRRLQWSILPVFSVMAPAAFAGLVMYLAGLAVSFVVGVDELPSIAQMAILIPLAALVYGGVLRLLARDNLFDALGMIRGVLVRSH